MSIKWLNMQCPGCAIQQKRIYYKTIEKISRQNSKFIQQLPTHNEPSYTISTLQQYGKEPTGMKYFLEISNNTRVTFLELAF